MSNFDLDDLKSVMSEKKVEFGLDLLANPEKKNKNVLMNEPPQQKNETHQAFNLNDFDTKTTGSIGNIDIDLEKLINDNSNIQATNNALNIETSSRLNDIEIEELIDQKDKNSILQRPTQTQADDNDIDKIWREMENNKEELAQPTYQPPVQRIDPQTEKREKEELLFKFSKMKKLGVEVPRNFNMTSDIEEMRAEMSRLTRERELMQSIKFQRKALMFVTSGIEFISPKIPFVNLELNGWSDQVHEGIDEYNEVFEELHEKYKTKGQMPPELRLLLMVGGSAFMYHLTNTMFKTSMPGLNDILKQNPDLARQFATAAVNQMPADVRPAANLFANIGMPQQQQQQQQQRQGPPPPQPPRTPFNNASVPMPMNFGNSEPAPFTPMSMNYGNPQNASNSVPLPPRVNRPPTPPQVVRPPPPPIKTQPERKINAPSGLDEILAELNGTPQTKNTPASNPRTEEVNNQMNDGKSISSMSSGRRKAKRQITLDL
jgi:hypothetical protein